MKKETVLIISNSEDISKHIASKIKLLRGYDNVQDTSYLGAISKLNTTQPSIIIVYCSNNDSINIIKEIREIKSLKKVPIMFVMDSFDEDKLTYAFDKGIDDFVFLSDADSVILMRVLLLIQKALLYKQININNEILTATNLLDKRTGIFNKEKSAIILKTFFSQSIEENMHDTIFMYVRPVAFEGRTLDNERISDVIKSVPRVSDIVTYGQNLGYYIILYHAGLIGAQSVYTRIKNLLSGICDIYINAAEIKLSFEEIEPIMVKTMKDQIQTHKEFNFLQNVSVMESADFIEIKDENGKTFKEFKKEFAENINRISEPLFNELKETCNKKYPVAKVEFKSSETEILFAISRNEAQSKIRITYPSYIKLIIDIEHKEVDKEPSIKRLSYDIEDFSEEQLKQVISDFIEQFEKSYIHNEEQI